MDWNMTAWQRLNLRMTLKWRLEVETPLKLAVKVVTKRGLLLQVEEAVAGECSEDRDGA